MAQVPSSPPFAELRPSHLTIEADPVLQTLNWLITRVKAQDDAFSQLQTRVEEIRVAPDSGVAGSYKGSLSGSAGAKEPVATESIDQSLPEMGFTAAHLQSIVEDVEMKLKENWDAQLQRIVEDVEAKAKEKFVPLHAEVQMLERQLKDEVDALKAALVSQTSLQQGHSKVESEVLCSLQGQPTTLPSQDGTNEARLQLLESQLKELRVSVEQSNMGSAGEQSSEKMEARLCLLETTLQNLVAEQSNIALERAHQAASSQGSDCKSAEAPPSTTSVATSLMHGLPAAEHSAASAALAEQVCQLELKLEQVFLALATNTKFGSSQGAHQSTSFVKEDRIAAQVPASSMSDEARFISLEDRVTSLEAARLATHEVNASKAGGEATASATGVEIPQASKTTDTKAIDVNLRLESFSAQCASLQIDLQDLRQCYTKLVQQLEHVERPVDGSGDDAVGASVKSEAVAEYVHQQLEIENRLKAFQEQLELRPQRHDVSGGLAGLVKDVRRCLKRCELIFQLPEIKVYIKRFQSSLEVNAVLQDKWLGPSARARHVFDDDVLAANSDDANEERSGRHLETSRSAVELSRSQVVGSRNKKADMRKKPFRTVTDWCRPHTPLTLEPVLNQHGDAKSEDARPTVLPQINANRN